MKENKKEGKGTLIKMNGNKFEGIFKENKEYEGDCCAMFKEDKWYKEDGYIIMKFVIYIMGI